MSIVTQASYNALEGLSQSNVIRDGLRPVSEPVAKTLPPNSTHPNQMLLDRAAPIVSEASEAPDPETLQHIML
jgi:hypothetical protein